MPVARTARERVRAEITAEIVAEARRQLAVHGAAGLSLRSVARELGMVSSAVYRYVASRDDLLTRLIVEAYDAVGEAAEHAARRSVDDPPAERLIAVANAIRRWARAHEHEYALVYGSPVPGYAAPPDTIGPASRVSLALAGVVVEAHRDGAIGPLPGPPAELPASTASDLAGIAHAVVGPHVDVLLDPELVLRLLVVWTQLFGLVSFELFGQTHGLVHDHAGLFETATRSMAAYLGLPGGGHPM